MPSAEELAKYVASQSRDLVEEEKRKGKYRQPPPPKPGEYIRCQQCGEIMLPENFDKDPVKRKWEFTWHMHWKCREYCLSLVDRQTPGLLSERKAKEDARNTTTTNTGSANSPHPRPDARPKKVRRY